MPYCSRCGVEVDDATSDCPLCEAPIQRLDAPASPLGAGPYPQHIIDPQDRYRLSRAERRRIAIEILSLVAILGSGALLLMDLLSSADLGWSRYAVASIVFGWTAACLPIALHGRPKAAVAAVGAASVAFLVVLDAMDGAIGWSLSLGAPIALTSFAAVLATATCIATRRVKGLNLLGIGAIGLAAYLVALEALLRIGLLGLERFGEVRPYWSLVAALALVPVAVFLFYLHGRVARGADLRKIFRL